MDQLAERLKPELLNIFGGVRHENLSQATLADIVDTIPIVGDIGNAVRMVREPNRPAQKRQAFDFLSGALPPPIGEAFDILTPTNIANFCLLPPPMPPIRKFQNRRR